MVECTFIIPTLGRGTLKRAVDSTKQEGANALVVFDTYYEVNYFPHNEPLTTVIKADVGGHAGLVRNYAMPLVTTEWLAFLDDDDWIEPTYMRRLSHYANDKDIVIFSYKDVTNGNIQPPKGTKEFKECQVGISFAIRTSFVKDNGLEFTPYAVEDFRFLDSARNAGARYVVTNEILYLVGGRGGWVRKD